MFRTVGKHVPLPPGTKPPPLWGTEERPREHFGDEAASLEATRRSFVFRFPSARHNVEYARARFGPTRKAFESLDETGREALARDPEELLDQWNILGDRTMVVPGDYLEVVAVRL